MSTSYSKVEPPSKMAHKPKFPAELHGRNRVPNLHIVPSYLTAGYTPHHCGTCAALSEAKVQPSPRSSQVHRACCWQSTLCRQLKKPLTLDAEPGPRLEGQRKHSSDPGLGREVPSQGPVGRSSVIWGDSGHTLKASDPWERRWYDTPTPTMEYQ